MKQRPILFSSEMVRAILDGRKTQTRRIIKPQPAGEDGPFKDYVKDCKYGQPGDRLWVRETWATHPFYNKVRPSDLKPAYTHVFYKAANNVNLSHYAWRPSIFMPRWASRITLEITGVRVERVQEINYGDAVAEGCYFREGETWGRLRFAQLWATINNEPGKRWEDNPWVWVMEFKRL